MYVLISTVFFTLDSNSINCTLFIATAASVAVFTCAEERILSFDADDDCCRRCLWDLACDEDDAFVAMKTSFSFPEAMHNKQQRKRA